MRRATLALLAAAVIAGCGGSGQPPLGPLGQERSVASGWSTSLEVGHRFADGYPHLRIPRDVDAVAVRDVQPLLSGDGLKFLGVMMALPNRPLASVQQVNSWPPVDPDVPEFVEAIGATLTGAESWGNFDFNMGYELFVGFEVVKAGRTTVQGYRVIYAHRGRTYSLVIPLTLAVCAYQPGELPRNPSCEDERQVNFDHD